MPKIIEVRLGDFRPVGDFDINSIECVRDQYVILEVDRGAEYGKVVSQSANICKSKTDHLVGKIIRVATEGDVAQIEGNRLRAKEAISQCERKIHERKLDMRIVKAEYSFDGSKVIFYFASEGRVDFRNLVKDLARVFRVRIELKQIGVRDKAKIVGGYGVCGRELCCSSYMKDFHPLSIKMSKEQGLPLNPTKISGVCGRIKCCMAYEYMVYREYAKTLPRLGDQITTPDGKGAVMAVNILKRAVSVDLGEGRVSKMIFAKSQEN